MKDFQKLVKAKNFVYVFSCIYIISCMYVYTRYTIHDIDEFRVYTVTSLICTLWIGPVVTVYSVSCVFDAVSSASSVLSRRFSSSGARRYATCSILSDSLAREADAGHPNADCEEEPSPSAQAKRAASGMHIEQNSCFTCCITSSRSSSSPATNMFAYTGDLYSILYTLYKSSL